MYRSILLPLDGSSFADEAVPMAALLSRKFESELHVVHVIRPIPDMDFKTPSDDLEWNEELREAATRVLGDLVSGLRKTGVNARIEIREGRAADALLETVEERKVDLVVLTSHGAGGFRRWWLGSVADSLIRSSHVPTLLVRPWDETEDQRPEGEPRFRTILVPVDGSEEAERAIPHARAIAEAVGGRMILARVVPSPLEVGSVYGVSTVRFERDTHREHREEAAGYFEELIARDFSGEGAGARPETRIVEAPGAAEGILEGAREEGADLIVLASRGRGGLGRAVIGSVADKVVRGAAPPVLVIPPAAE